LSTPQIAIVNESTAVTDAQVQQLAAALAIQVNRDWYPAWGSNPIIRFYVGYKPSLLEANTAILRPPPNAWILAILDDSDQADALGYHDQTPTGQPLGKCFAKSTMQDGESWTVCASHELLEMLGDPDINLGAQVGNLWWAYEVCDPAEDDSYGYKITLPGSATEILVSDFVLPSWFQSFDSPGQKYDFQGHISKPFEVLTGGYSQTFSDATGWVMVNPEVASKHAGSRLERREIVATTRMRSHFGAKPAGVTLDATLATELAAHTADAEAHGDAAPVVGERVQVEGGEFEVAKAEGGEA
jgi:hypothetical protein